MVNDVDGNDSGCVRVRTVAEEGLSIDVQGRRCAARGQDQLRVAEVVGTDVAVGKGPNHCGLERSLEKGKPGKPIVRLLSRLDPVLQIRKAVVGGLVHGKLGTLRVVEFYIEVAVLATFGDGDARPDCCLIFVKCDSELGPIGALVN